MLRTALRPAFRSLPRQTRALSSSNGPAVSTANYVGAAAALAAAAGLMGYGYYTDRRRLSMAIFDKGAVPSVRESVLDQPSLKENIHKRSGEPARLFTEGEVAKGCSGTRGRGGAGPAEAQRARGGEPAA